MGQNYKTFYGSTTAAALEACTVERGALFALISQ
jgi:hypothetical protein